MPVAELIKYYGSGWLWRFAVDQSEQPRSAFLTKAGRRAWRAPIAACLSSFSASDEAFYWRHLRDDYVASDFSPRQRPEATFVLVHGFYNGGWCWGRVADLLERAATNSMRHRSPAMETAPSQ